MLRATCPAMLRITASFWRMYDRKNPWAIFKSNSARSTSIFSINCSEAVLGGKCGCSMRAAVPAATWSTFSKRGTMCSAWTRTRTRWSRRAGSLLAARRLYLRATFGWSPSRKRLSQMLSLTSCSVAPCSTSPAPAIILERCCMAPGGY